MPNPPHLGLILVMKYDSTYIGLLRITASKVDCTINTSDNNLIYNDPLGSEMAAKCAVELKIIIVEHKR